MKSSNLWKYNHDFTLHQKIGGAVSRNKKGNIQTRVGKVGGWKTNPASFPVDEAVSSYANIRTTKEVT